MPWNSMNILHWCAHLNNLGQYYEWFPPWIRDYVCTDSSRDKEICYICFKRRTAYAKVKWKSQKEGACMGSICVSRGIVILSKHGFCSHNLLIFIEIFSSEGQWNSLETLFVTAVHLQFTEVLILSTNMLKHWDFHSKIRVLIVMAYYARA